MMWTFGSALAFEENSMSRVEMRLRVILDRRVVVGSVLMRRE
jgi:hypothetical protein